MRRYWNTALALRLFHRRTRRPATLSSSGPSTSAATSAAGAVTPRAVPPSSPGRRRPAGLSPARRAGSSGRRPLARRPRAGIRRPSAGRPPAPRRRRWGHGRDRPERGPRPEWTASVPAAAVQRPPRSPRPRGRHLGAANITAVRGALPPAVSCHRRPPQARASHGTQLIRHPAIHAFRPFPFKLSGARCQVNFQDPSREHSACARERIGKPGFARAANITIYGGLRRCSPRRCHLRGWP
jgi:hypothetical protein